MKIKKFAHNCLLIDYKSVRILVDPGNVEYFDGLTDIWTNINIILVTHMNFSNTTVENFKFFQKLYILKP